MLRPYNIDGLARFLLEELVGRGVINFQNLNYYFIALTRFTPVVYLLGVLIVSAGIGQGKRLLLKKKETKTSQVRMLTLFAFLSTVLFLHLHFDLTVLDSYIQYLDIILVTALLIFSTVYVNLLFSIIQHSLFNFSGQLPILVSFYWGENKLIAVGMLVLATLLYSWYVFVLFSSKVASRKNQ